MYPNSLKFPLILVSKCHFTGRFLNTTTMALKYSLICSASYYSLFYPPEKYVVKQAQKTRHLWNGPSDVTLVSHKRWLHEEGHIEFAHPLIIIGCKSSVVKIVWP